MPGRVHEHNGWKVYHRPDGALMFHGEPHARYSLGRDKKHKTDKKGKIGRPPKKGYPHAGDGRPKHQGKNRKIKGSK